MKNRTPEYWPTRGLVAIGFIATVIAMTLSFKGPLQVMYISRPVVLGLPAIMVVVLVGLATGLFGFAWMLRIFRGPRDEPPVWRYRDG